MSSYLILIRYTLAGFVGTEGKHADNANTNMASVTRLGDFLHFEQPLKAGGNNYFTQIAHIGRQFL